jgi:hypothetical protein
MTMLNAEAQDGSLNSISGEIARQTARIVSKKVYWLAAGKAIIFDNTFSSEVFREARRVGWEL